MHSSCRQKNVSIVSPVRQHIQETKGSCPFSLGNTYKFIVDMLLENFLLVTVIHIIYIYI